jgi:hypothetical protein
MRVFNKYPANNILLQIGQLPSCKRRRKKKKEGSGAWNEPGIYMIVS